MAELEKITIQTTLTFDALIAGEPGAPLVLLLHGFAESMHCWDAQVEALAGAGYRAIAPSQRGYSAGARPDTGDTANYHIDRLMDDAMAIVAASGYGGRRFHLAGHDWGGSIAWALADRIPSGWPRSPCCRGRIPTPSIARCNCPTAIRRTARGTTRRFSSPMRPMSFWPTTPNGCASVWRPLAFPPPRSRGISAVLGNKPAMEAALAWYRARGAIRGPLGPIRVPTLYIWGDADDTVGRVAAEGTADFVEAPYRFEVLPGVGHFAADQAPERVSELLLQHLAAYPA